MNANPAEDILVVVSFSTMTDVYIRRSKKRVVSKEKIAVIFAIIIVISSAALWVSMGPASPLSVRSASSSTETADQAKHFNLDLVEDVNVKSTP